MSIQVIRTVKYLVVVELDNEEKYETENTGYSSRQTPRFVVDRITWSGWEEADKGGLLLTTDSYVSQRGANIKKNGETGERRVTSNVKITDLPGDLGDRMLAAFNEVYKP